MGKYCAKLKALYECKIALVMLEGKETPPRKCLQLHGWFPLIQQFTVLLYIPSTSFDNYRLGTHYVQDSVYTQMEKL